MYKLIIGIIILIVLSPNLFGQEIEKRLCICFDKDSTYINQSYSQDSSFVALNITIEGYETDEAREKAKREAIEKHKSSMLLTYHDPIFIKVYLSNNESTITGVHEKIFGSCKASIPLSQFRKENLPLPEDTSQSRVYFISKIGKNLYKKWSAVLDAIE